jgi:hypothetical protein
MANWSNHEWAFRNDPQEQAKFYDRVQDKLVDDEGQIADDPHPGDMWLIGRKDISDREFLAPLLDNEPACGICGCEPNEHAYSCDARGEE